MQVIDAIWYAGVQWVGTAVIFAAADPRLLVPLMVWLAAYIVVLIIFVPRIKERSTEASEARSMLVGRIVDTYTNILTVKLFAHADARGRLRPRRAAGADGQVAGLAARADGHGACACTA